MIPIVTPAQMNQADADVAAGITGQASTAQLIQRAGAAVAFEARRLMGGTYGKRVLVISGPGNNGADGATSAQLLKSWGARCDVLTPAAVSTAGPAAGPVESKAAPEWLSPNDCGECFDLVIDAAFGTGLRSAWNPTPQPSAPVLAVDVPSGIDALSGYDYGSWSAEVTLTFAAVKPGLLLHPGAAKVGELKVVDLGTELAEAASSLASAQLLTDSDADTALVPTATNAHKWQTAVRVVAGSQKYSGAGYLTCAAALQAGAGMVALSVPGGAARNIQRPTEVVAVSTGGDWVKDVLSDIERYALLVIGPGIGTDHPVLLDSVLRDTAELIERCPVPVVVDADALTAVAEQPSCVQNRQAVTVLTPHEGEFARLVAGLASSGLATTGSSSSGPDLKQDRFQAVRSAAEMFQSIVLLKGPTTLVALPTQSEQAQSEQAQPEKPSTVYAITAGTQQLATAGSGDVLAGVIAGALASAASASTTSTNANTTSTASTNAASTNTASATTAAPIVAPIVAAAAHWHGRTTTTSSHHHTPLPATQQIALLPTARSHIARSHVAAKTDDSQQ